MAELHIGTSGWAYPHWSGPFYPEDLQEEAWLAHYVGHFRSVEINNSFYQLPAPATLARWRDTVPGNFTFAVKASRYITHMKKLKNPEDTIPGFLERVETLDDRLGPILFQLPPRWHSNPERLRYFLSMLPRSHRYTFEFRDSGWIEDAVLEQLRAFGAAFCIYELAGTRTPLHVTADFAYVRLHGPGNAYQGCYDEETLRGWAETLRGWLGEGRDVYCYFDNDEAGYAAINAGRLLELAGS